MGDGDGWVEVGPGDVAHGVHQNHDGETPHDGDPRQRHHLVVVQVHHHRHAPREYQKVCTQKLCYQLYIKMKMKNRLNYQMFASISYQIRSS